VIIRLIIWMFIALFRWMFSSSSSTPNYTASTSNYNTGPQMHVNCPYCNNQMYAVANVCNACGRNRHTGQYGQ